MPRINLDLNALSQDRSTLQSVVAEQRGLDTAVLSRKTHWRRRSARAHPPTRLRNCAGIA